MTAARWEGDALILELQVQPGASRDAIVGMHGARIKVRITAPPVDGRANDHLVGYLAAVFGTARAAITIRRGSTGRSKTVSVAAPQTVPPLITEALSASTTATGSSSAARRCNKH